MTNTNNKQASTRFDGRKTQVTFECANFDTMQKETHTFECDYLRSNDKAEKAAREQFKLDDSWFIRIVEIVNEKPKQTKYNDGKVYDFAIAHYHEEEDANKAAKASDNYKVVKIRWFEYEGAFWAYNETNDSYITDFVHDDSPMLMTKADMRHFIAHSAHELCGYEVLAVHNCKRAEAEMYCVIEETELAKCVEAES